MATDSLNVDIEVLIEEVQKYPTIWDMSSEEFKDNTKKKQAWRDICKVFYSDFDVLTNAVKNEISQKLLSKWRNVKDSFLRSIRGKQKSGQRRRYIYSKQLAFLLDSQHFISALSSVDEDNSQTSSAEHNMLENVLETVLDESPTNSQNESQIPLKRRRKDEIEECLMQFMSAPVPTFPPLQQSVTQKEDDDRSFFESLLPAVRLFDVDQKLEFRGEIIKLLKNIRKKGSSEV